MDLAALLTEAGEYCAAVFASKASAKAAFIFTFLVLISLSSPGMI